MDGGRQIRSAGVPSLNPHYRAIEPTKPWQTQVSYLCDLAAHLVYFWNRISYHNYTVQNTAGSHQSPRVFPLIEKIPTCTLCSLSPISSPLLQRNWSHLVPQLPAYSHLSSSSTGKISPTKINRNSLLQIDYLNDCKLCPP